MRHLSKEIIAVAGVAAGSGGVGITVAQIMDVGIIDAGIIAVVAVAEVATTSTEN